MDLGVLSGLEGFRWGWQSEWTWETTLGACVRSVGPNGWVAPAGSGRSGLPESYELDLTLRPHVRSNIWFARGLSTAPDTMNDGLRPYERFPKRGFDVLVDRLGLPDEFNLPSRSWPRRRALRSPAQPAAAAVSTCCHWSAGSRRRAPGGPPAPQPVAALRKRLQARAGAMHQQRPHLAV